MLTAWQIQRASQSFYNTTGETIPPYACMELDYFNESGLSANEIPTDTQNLFWRVKKPTSEAVTDPGRVVFNGPTQVGGSGYGEFQVAGFLLAAFDNVDGSPAPGSRVGPKSGSWYLTSESMLYPFVSYDSGRALYESAAKRTIWINRAGSTALGKNIFFEVTGAEIAGSSSPYSGLTILTVDVICEGCEDDVASVEVVDWSDCLANAEELAELIGRQGWAVWWRGRQSRATGATLGEKTPCHYGLSGLCCPP